MEKKLSKEELEQLIKDQLELQLKERGLETTEYLKAQMKEVIDECLKEYGKTSKKTPFDTGEEDPKGGFKTMGEFAYEVFCAGEGMTNPSPKLKAWNEKSMAIMKTAGSPAQSTGSLQAGGALIPPEYSTMSLTRARERSTIMQKAMTIPMSTDRIEIPHIKDFNESTGKVAGNIKFRWVAETTTGTGNEVQFEMINLTLREANAMIYLPNRLIKFSPVSMQPFMTTGVDNALDFALSDSFISGTGAGQPLGVLNAPCLVSVAKETNQKADTLVYENTLNMLARFYGNTGEWYANRTIIPQLGVMSVDVGAGGSAVFIAGNSGVQQASGTFPATLHGAPLNYNQVMPILGDVGDLLFADWSQYLIGTYSASPGLEMTESAHLKFDFRQTAFNFTFYIDGQPWWPDPLSPYKGDTLSPFVCIAARA